MTKPILSDPRHGWATLTLPTENDEQPFITSISYVTDVMFNALTACINYLDNEIAAVKFNAEENGDIIILIDTCDCKVIYETDCSHGQARESSQLTFTMTIRIIVMHHGLPIRYRISAMISTKH